MQTVLQVPEVNKDVLIWLEALYESLKQGKKPNAREIRAALYEKLPVTFRPAAIDPNLAYSNGERITLLGIMAVEGNKSIMEKADRVVIAIRDLLLKQPMLERIMTTEIAVQAGLIESEVSMILDLIYNYARFYRGTGGKSGTYGITEITLEEFNFDQYMSFTSIETLILQHQKTIPNEVEGNNQETEAGDIKNKDITTARQVLAVTFLLKRCGINPVDKLTPVTKFMQFLTNKEINVKKIQNTNIYKRVKSPFKLNDKELLKDLRYIKDYFSDMGMIEVVADIDREIAQSEKSG